MIHPSMCLEPPAHTTLITTVTRCHLLWQQSMSLYSLYNRCSPGTEVVTIAANDRDTGDFGTAGIVYELAGSGADLFSADPVTGTISVAPCPTPGKYFAPNIFSRFANIFPGSGECLDYEQTRAYFLSFSATDNGGLGKTSVVNLRITLVDDNDNPPAFESTEYRANIDEGEGNFQPSLIVKANDLDDSSRLRYTITNGNIKNLFRLDKNSGELLVNSNEGLRLDNIPTNKIVLNVEVSDGKQSDFTTVEVAVRDVNDRSPTFERAEYSAVIPEDTPIGLIVEQVKATDADYGANAEITYRIQKGAYDDFAIDPSTGEVTLSGQLNYDTRPFYELEIVAVDGGYPSLSGWSLDTSLALHVPFI